MDFPALDISGVDAGLALAVVDDYSPSAADERAADRITIFFNDAARRDAAAQAIRTAHPEAVVAARDVGDEDWARRSQENLTPITVGRVTVTPPWFAAAPQSAASVVASTVDLQPPDAVTIVITPSMGFGTGHHATTRLCLAAMQEVGVEGKTVLDVGTGSGVLAIAAVLLGATRATGIDVDPDAIASARENLEANPAAAPRVRFEVADLREASLSQAEVVLANLTGAVLIRNARLLASSVAPGGVLIVSGLQIDERDDVVRAFSGARVAWAREEAGWGAVAFNFPDPGTV